MTLSGLMFSDNLKALSSASILLLRVSKSSKWFNRISNLKKKMEKNIKIIINLQVDLLRQRFKRTGAARHFYATSSPGSGKTTGLLMSVFQDLMMTDPLISGQYVIVSPTYYILLGNSRFQKNRMICTDA